MAFTDGKNPFRNNINVLTGAIANNRIRQLQFQSQNGKIKKKFNIDVMKQNRK